MKLKRISILLGCLMLAIVGGCFYKSFKTKNENTDLYLAYYVNDTLQKEMPSKESGLVLDEERSYCGVSGEKDTNIKVSLTEDFVLEVSGMTSSRTKCYLFFKEKPLEWPEDFIGKIDENGNGLYEEEHTGVEITDENEGIVPGWDTKELRYAGPNPDNYVDFNGEKWRIIGLVNVQTTNGTITQRLKIIKADVYTSTQWDSGNVNNWANASLQTTLNGTYLSEIQTTSKNMIATDIRWNLGGYSASEEVITSQYYQYERGTTVYQGRPTYWENPGQATVALMYPSDYGYASSGGSTYNRSQCLAKDLRNWDGTGYKTDCAGNDWLYDSSNAQWTLMPYSGFTRTVFSVYSAGYVNLNYASASSAVRPVVYLSSDVHIDGGRGTKENSFQLAQQKNT